MTSVNRTDHSDIIIISNEIEKNDDKTTISNTSNNNSKLTIKCNLSNENVCIKENVDFSEMKKRDFYTKVNRALSGR